MQKHIAIECGKVKMMNEETTEPNLKTVLDEIQKLSEKVDKNQKQNDAQFKAIRQGIVQNSAAFDRLESVVYIVRSDISALKADMKELTEEVHQINKSNETLALK